MKLFISDETLRDGEQQVGVNFLPQDKKIITQSLSDAGIDMISIMPAISKYETDTSVEILKGDLKKKMTASTMLIEDHIQNSFDLGFQSIILFAVTSEHLAQLQGKSLITLLEEVVRLAQFAHNKGLIVDFAAVDATRANLKDLIPLINSLQPYIRYFIVCDTVGVFNPVETKILIENLKQHTQCKLGIHMHNDKGHADENTVQAVVSGVELISGTINGIGERAGNADLVNVLFRLKEMGIVCSQLDYDKLKELKDLFTKRYKYSRAEPYSEQAFFHESGIHVDGLLKDPLSFSPFLPEKFGKHHTFFYGKQSGVANYHYLFPQKYSKEEYVLMRDYIKEISYQQNKSFSEKEAKILIAEKFKMI